MLLVKTAPSVGSHEFCTASIVCDSSDDLQVMFDWWGKMHFALKIQVKICIWGNRSMLIGIRVAKKLQWSAGHRPDTELAWLAILRKKREYVGSKKKLDIAFDVDQIADHA